MAKVIKVEREVLQCVFDTAVSSLDFGSGFLDHKEVNALRTIAKLLGVDPEKATPYNFLCEFNGHTPYSDERIAEIIQIRTRMNGFNPRFPYVVDPVELKKECSVCFKPVIP
jgi:hypothetical protein